MGSSDLLQNGMDDIPLCGIILRLFEAVLEANLRFGFNIVMWVLFPNNIIYRPSVYF